MAVMTASELWLPANRPMTVADLDLTPDDGRRYELDDGVLVVTPPPAFSHELVVMRLGVALSAAGTPEFAIAGASGIEMSDVRYRIPDLIVVRTASVALTDRNVKIPPELVVEVASPSTAAYDRNRKKAVYAEFGIPAYWIVVPDPDSPSITAYTLDGASYAQVGRAVGDDEFASDHPFPVVIVPADLVAGNWRADR
jgi:Uma2 family endonuclease